MHLRRINPATDIRPSVVGNYDFHYHKFTNWEVSETIGNHDSLTVVDHTHSIPQEDSSLSSASAYRVYVNKEANPTDYVIDTSSGRIKFNSEKINMTYPIYSCSFKIRGDFYHPDVLRTYTFELETQSIEQFIVQMMKDFYSKYGKEVDDGVGFEWSSTSFSVAEKGSGMWDFNDTGMTQLLKYDPELIFLELRFISAYWKFVCGKR